MEKFSQFRDRGSGVSPFLPSKTPSTLTTSLPRTFLFLFRLPIFLSYSLLYFLLLQHLPLPAIFRKLLLWTFLSIPGVWWVDLQLDGVKRGSLSQQPPSRVPHPRSIIAANFTSPIDALYLAAIFDPIFTVSYPGSRQVRQISLLAAMRLALSPAQLDTTPSGTLTDLNTLTKRYPDRIIVVFPECATTNGKGILPLSPSLLAAPADVAIFPLSMRYTPPDITTPIPGFKSTLFFLWKLLSRPTHTIRVRIAEGMHNTSAASNGTSGKGVSSAVPQRGVEGGDEGVTAEEMKVLNGVADALARLGRASRVGLEIGDKKRFVEAWGRR